MEYTVQKLGRMAGISARTLRYYDQLGILKPARINSSGYRLYGQAQVDRLQQVLFYRELGFSLENIREIVTAPAFDAVKALRGHRDRLLEKRGRLDLLIANVDRTIALKEGKNKMADPERFKGFKEKLTQDNEQRYGKEARERYGDEAVNRANAKFQGMSQAEYEEVTRLENEFAETLKAAFETGDPSSELAQKAADLHRRWLSFYWDCYTQAAHVGVTQMYIDGERFTAYYDRIQPGAAAFLRDAVLIYTGTKK